MKEMNNWKRAITWATCCCISLTVAPSAPADFVGVTMVNKIDPDIEFLCNKGNGDFVPGALGVCNVLAVFDNPDDVLLSVGNSDLQVYDGQNPDVFFQHPLNFNGSTSPGCDLIPVFPDLICDSFVTIGLKCAPGGPYEDSTYLDADFDAGEFNTYGHIVGGWYNSYPYNGQGDAGSYPDLQVLFLQSSVASGLTLSGVIDIFWTDTADVYAEIAVPIECDPGCPNDYPCNDGDPCTHSDICKNQACQGTPVDCDDSNPCTDDFCDPASGQCVNLPNNNPCDDGDACTEGDQCGEDGCVHGTPVDCDDGDECTEDACDPAIGCTFGPVDCDDDDACTDDFCDPILGCYYEMADCDDGDFCTDDGCDHDGTGACVHMPTEICDDGNACTEDGCDSDTGCTHEDIDCSDGNPCTDDLCDPEVGCTHEDIVCSEGQVCDPANGECVAEQDPCECVDGRVTLCHLPPGNLANARTITVGCAARDKHLAHGDFCGPCE